MAARRSQKVEAPKVIGAISKFVGALVGTAVVTGKRIVKPPAQADKKPSAKPRKKSVRARSQKRKEKKQPSKESAKK